MSCKDDDKYLCERAGAAVGSYMESECEVMTEFSLNALSGEILI